jgi:hypothetical protein
LRAIRQIGGERRQALIVACYCRRRAIARAEKAGYARRRFTGDAINDVDMRDEKQQSEGHGRDMRPQQVLRDRHTRQRRRSGEFAVDDYDNYVGG